MGSFLNATLFIQGVRDGSIRLDDPEAYPKGMDAFFRQDLRRRFPGDGDFARSRSILEVLAAVQVVPTNLLCDALGLSL